MDRGRQNRLGITTFRGRRDPDQFNMLASNQMSFNSSIDSFKNPDENNTARLVEKLENSVHKEVLNQRKRLIRLEIF